MKTNTNTLTKEDIEHVDLIANMMLSTYSTSLEKDDLVQVGLLAYWKLKKRFDASRNIKLRTFAEQRIKGVMLDEMRRGWRNDERFPTVDIQPLADQIPIPSDNDQAIHDELIRIAEILIELLPDQCVEVVSMRLADANLSQAELAKLSGKSVRTIQRNLREAILKLRQLSNACDC